MGREGVVTGAPASSADSVRRRARDCVAARDQGAGSADRARGRAAVEVHLPSSELIGDRADASPVASREPYAACLGRPRWPRSLCGQPTAPFRVPTTGLELCSSNHRERGGWIVPRPSVLAPMAALVGDAAESGATRNAMDQLKSRRAVAQRPFVPGHRRRRI